LPRLDPNTTLPNLNNLEHEDIHVYHIDPNDLQNCLDLFGNDPTNDLQNCLDLFDNDPNDLKNRLDLFDNDPTDLLQKAVLKLKQSLVKCGVCQIRTLAYLPIYVDNDGKEHYLTVYDRCVINVPECHWSPYVKVVIIIYKNYSNFK
jgi:hypothetical protein